MKSLKNAHRIQGNMMQKRQFTHLRAQEASRKTSTSGSTTWKLLLNLFIICVSWKATLAQEKDKPFPISYTEENIQTVLLHPEGLPAELPFVSLESQTLAFKFDDLIGSYRTLELRWHHCTFDWFKSPDLINSDFIQGFPSLSLNNAEASFNTRVPYIHYSIEFPNDLMRFTKSGNYILEVIDPSTPNTPLIIRRFVVYEGLVDIELDVQDARSIPLKRTHQELDFVINHNPDGFSIQDAYDALQTNVLQNGRWDGVISGMEPVFVKGNQVVFSQQGEGPFEGGNSWRFADLKSLRYISQGLDRIEEGRNYFHVYMKPDELRTYSYHQARADLNGAYVISNERQSDHTGGEYVMTHFYLSCYDPYPDLDVYVFGQCSQWMFPMTHRMNWNERTRRYELSLFLKQGYYNYLYVTRPKWAANKYDNASLSNGKALLSTVEGSHAAANNTYQVIAYYWDSSGYDRVIGFESGQAGVY